MRRVTVTAIFLFIFVFIFSPAVQAAAATGSLQSQIDANNQVVTLLNQEIARYEAQIKQAGANKKTLQAAIDALNLQRSKVQAQISATQHQINTTQLQIAQLGSSIASAQDSISANQAAIGASIRNLQEMDNQPFVSQVFSSSSLSDIWRDADAMFQMQDAIQNKISILRINEKKLVTSQAASKEKKDSLTLQKTALASQQQTLVATTRSKAQLLVQTQAKEANYQKLLAQAKAELASFSTFAQNAGGSGLLANQTRCDNWGCYYNQRDTLWGNNPLNGTKYALKSDGCLVTSMAMILTHYGYKDVTPITINSNPSNFAVYYPAYLLYTISVDGITATRKSAAIDATLATGNPVVVGVHAYGGTHYVVLTSGSRGNYLMRDPYIPNAKDVSFSAHYAIKNIFGIARVVISS